MLEYIAIIVVLLILVVYYYYTMSAQTGADTSNVSPGIPPAPGTGAAAYDPTNPTYPDSSGSSAPPYNQPDTPGVPGGTQDFSTYVSTINQDISLLLSQFTIIENVLSQLQQYLAGSSLLATDIKKYLYGTACLAGLNKIPAAATDFNNIMSQFQPSGTKVQLAYNSDGTILSTCANTQTFGLQCDPLTILQNMQNTHAPSAAYAAISSPNYGPIANAIDLFNSFITSANYKSVIFALSALCDFFLHLNPSPVGTGPYNHVVATGAIPNFKALGYANTLDGQNDYNAISKMISERLVGACHNVGNNGGMLTTGYYDVCGEWWAVNGSGWSSTTDSTNYVNDFYTMLSCLRQLNVANANLQVYVVNLQSDLARLNCFAISGGQSCKGVTSIKPPKTPQSVQLYSGTPAMKYTAQPKGGYQITGYQVPQYDVLKEYGPFKTLDACIRQVDVNAPAIHYDGTHCRSVGNVATLYPAAKSQTLITKPNTLTPAIYPSEVPGYTPIYGMMANYNNKYSAVTPSDGAKYSTFPAFVYDFASNQVLTVPDVTAGYKYEENMVLYIKNKTSSK